MKGTHRPGLHKQRGVGGTATLDAPIVIAKDKDTPLRAVPAILRTVQSVERAIERDQQQQQAVEKGIAEVRKAPTSSAPAAQAEEKAAPKKPFLIPSRAGKKPPKTQETVARAMAEPQVTAPSENPEIEQAEVASRANVGTFFLTTQHTRRSLSGPKERVSSKHDRGFATASPDRRRA